MSKLHETYTAREQARRAVQDACAEIRIHQDARLAAMAGLTKAQDELRRATKALVELTTEYTALLHADTSGVIGSLSKAQGELLGPVADEDRPGAVL